MQVPCRPSNDRDDLLQSLIKSALRASSPALAASLRHVLEGLHSQRLTPGTDAMLLRLYHPLLFRDLAAANAGVRNNALQLLVDAFPLQDSTASAEVSRPRIFYASFAQPSRRIMFANHSNDVMSLSGLQLADEWLDRLLYGVSYCTVMLQISCMVFVAVFKMRAIGTKCAVSLTLISHSNSGGFVVHAWAGRAFAL